MKTNPKYTGLEIAIVGMACRFPGAANWREFWNNLVNGVESTRFFSEQELLDMGVDRETSSRPGFVAARNRMENKERFDSAFFDYLPGEARLMNPTHRLFHECVWEAMEDAGYSAPQQKDATGVFAGADDDLNWRVYAMLENRKQQLMDEFSLSLVAKQDNLATLVSYKLNLKGPAITLNTACSTSLTAVDMACKSLLLGESRMALAGGITVVTEKQAGYFYKEGMIYSSDGHCRPFDSEASGTTGSEGVGVVVLKKLNDALKDGDQIYAIIKGSSVNNDGNDKVGFTAPSVTGQADCIRKAHRIARVEPDTIGYVEAHGTATRLGDPIEVEALTVAFKNANHSCALGSVKSNIGHTGSAAGVAGLIKTALCLKHGMIPPSINFSNPNPAIDFSSSPFYVNQSLKKFERRDDTPLRAGISSFGIGGTNVHAVLEEAPQQDETIDTIGYKLLTLSAKTEKSLRRYIGRLKDFLAADEPVNLSDMAYTFQVGRKHFEYRRSIAFGSREELLSLLETEANEPVTRAKGGPHKIVFLFSGQGAQYAHMAAGLYNDVPLFREEMDKGLTLVHQLTGEDFKEVLFPTAGQEYRINETRYTQPLIFLLEYALARVVMSLGLVPGYMIGHSIGEYTAAAISGVLSFEDAVRLVVKRGELMNSLPAGSMLSVLMSEEEAKALATGNIYLATVNAPGRVVFSGEKEAIDALHKKLKAQDISCIPLQTSHAFHSGMQDPILDEFGSEVARTSFGKISTPFLSNLTGDFITEEQASSPGYWKRHLRNTVQFSAGIQTLLAQEGSLQFIEIGPGQSLCGLLKQQPGQQAQTPVNLVRSEKTTANDLKHFTEALGQLWALGTSIDWSIYHKDEKRRRISLPTYSFEPTKYITEVNLTGSGLTLDNNFISLTAQKDIKESEQEPDPALSYDPEDKSLTVTEKKVKSLFRGFFGVEALSLSDNFFTLGGDSLKGLVLIKKIKEEFGVELTLKQFFERPMLNQVAYDIDELKSRGADGQPAVPVPAEIPKAPVMDGYPLSSSQRRSWVLSQFGDGNAAYNMPGVYIFEGDLDTQAFEHAFTALINRHEALRTVFREDPQGEIKQFINSPADSGGVIIWQDFRNQQDRDSLVRSSVAEDISRPFDLANGPLIRARICRIEERKWVFTYVTHHIISDGWSLGILFQELVQFYEEHIRGLQSPGPVLRIQFRDYSAWQQAELQGDGMKVHKEYWMKQFEGDLPVLELKGDRPRPLVKTYNGGNVTRMIPARLVNAVRAMSSEQNGTLFMSLLAVLKVLLHRYTGQEDIIIGFPIAGRPHAELENQIGFYVNTLPLRTRFSGNDTYRELFDKIKQVTVEAYEHQAFPFDEIVNSLSLRRDMSRSALFDVMAVIQKTDPNRKEMQRLGHVQVTNYELSTNPASIFDVVFNFIEIGDGLRMSVDYNSDIFDKETIIRFVNHYQQLLEAVLQDPAQPIGKIQFLTPAERKQLVAGFNGVEELSIESLEPSNKTADDYRNKTIVSLIEEQVARNPQDIALVFKGKEISYAELNERANRLAYYLRERYALQNDDRVGIRLERTEWVVIALLGVLKAGAAYVPIATDYPQERIDLILKDSGCKAFINQQELDTFRSEMQGFNGENPTFNLQPSHLAYVIYTSGSTGKPKGVMVEHRNVTALLENMQSRCFLEPGMVFGSVTNYTFDISVVELLGTLATGMQIRLIDDTAPLNIIEYIRYGKINALQITPSRLALLEDADPGFMNTLKNLETLLVTGEALGQYAYERLKTLEGIRVVNVYGPTETTVWSTSLELTSSTRLTIGKPLMHEHVLILDAQGGLSPIGAAGELCIGGAGLARGYLNRPDLTGERFVPHPFIPGGRMYRTGDLGYWLADGSIEFIGRGDEQVKIRGYRIELGEIESALQGHPDVSSCVVIAKAIQQEKELIAYVTSGRELKAGELRTWLGKSLPNYMIPAHYVQLDALPLTTSGKADRKKLPDPGGLGLSTGVEYVAPRTETEEKLAAIWQQVLGREKISVKDDFFELGGHSLKASYLSSQVHRVFEVRLSLSVFFENPGFEEQARIIEQGIRTAYIAIEKAPHKEYYPLSSAQSRLSFLQEFAPQSTSYNMPMVHYMGKEADPQRIATVLHKLIARHESLRTSFKKIDGVTMQKIHTEVPFELDIHECVPHGFADYLGSYIRPFNLAQAPLLRSSLVHIKEVGYAWIVDLHHIISDGTSQQVLAEDFIRLYRGEELPELRLQYRDFSEWQNSLRQSGELQKQKEYWLSRLEGDIPRADLPADRPRPVSFNFEGSVHSFTIQPKLTAAVREFCRKTHSTLQMTLLSVLNVLLHKYTGQDDLVIGHGIAGRRHSDLERIVGMFVNTLAIRVFPEGDKSFGDFHSEVTAACLAAYDNQDIQFEDLVNMLQVERDPSRNPVFDITLVVQNFNRSAESLSQFINPGALPRELTQVGKDLTSKFDMTWFVEERGEDLLVNLEYYSAIYDLSTIERLSAHFINILEAAVQKPDLLIEEIPLLDTASERDLLETYASGSGSADPKALRF